MYKRQILISILAGALITTENTLLRIALKLLLLPVVMSISYEIIKLCGRYDNPLTRAVSAPGPVSYTHLDVYKRQAAAARVRCTRPCAGAQGLRTLNHAKPQQVRFF